MKALKERILRDGKCFDGGILKVDNFINHQMDPILMKSMAVEFVRRFASTSINKVMTVEASGIAPAIMVGYLLELPVVFAKKKVPSTMENMLATKVYSFTKGRTYATAASTDLIYQLEDRPPLRETLFAAIQHLLAIFVALITPSLIIAGALQLDVQTTGYLVSMSLFASGSEHLQRIQPSRPLQVWPHVRRRIYHRHGTGVCHHFH